MPDTISGGTGSPFPPGLVPPEDELDPLEDREGLRVEPEELPPPEGLAGL